MDRVPRYQDEGGTELELRLLQSARDDRMPASTRLALANLAGMASGEAASVTPALLAPSKSSRSATQVVIRWVSTFLVGSGVMTGVIWGESRQTSLDTPPSLVVAPKDPLPDLDLPTLPGSERASRQAPVDESSPHLAEPPALPPRSVKPASSSPSVSSLADEMQCLQRARQGLRDGRANDALQTLDQYRRKYPQGVLRDEAAVVRIDATMKTGDRPAATRLARQFLDTHPVGLYSERVESMLKNLESVGAAK